MEKRMEQLLYRRQYVIGSTYLDLQGWKQYQVSGTIFITAHPDLEVEQSVQQKLQLTLLGYLVDPFHPDQSNADILQSLLDRCRTFEEVLLHSEHLGGRWVLIINDGVQVRLIHDPCGLRQVFYAKVGASVWCAPLASTLATYIQAELETDAEVQDLLTSTAFQKMEQMWPGDSTPYKGIKRLLPNHCLFLNDGRAERFWPLAQIERLDRQIAIETAARLLQGSIRAIANRSACMLAVTAGWDSRVLLAASKAVSKEIFYYISLHSALPETSSDVTIPARLLPQLGIDFHILPPIEKMDDSFVKLNRKNAGMRDLPKSETIYQHFLHSQGRVNISGNCSEVSREAYYDYHPRRTYSGRFLARHMKYAKHPFAIRQYEKWLAESQPYAERAGINVLSFFHWEQDFGTWGGTYPAEQDIAIEEFSPFNNRTLLISLLMIDDQDRPRPNNKLYKELIEYLWPEVLQLPVNPPNFKGKLKNGVKTLIKESFHHGYKWMGMLPESREIKMRIAPNTVKLSGKEGASCKQSDIPR